MVWALQQQLPPIPSVHYHPASPPRLLFPTHPPCRPLPARALHVPAPHLPGEEVCGVWQRTRTQDAHCSVRLGGDEGRVCVACVAAGSQAGQQPEQGFAATSTNYLPVQGARRDAKQAGEEGCPDAADELPGLQAAYLIVCPRGGILRCSCTVPAAHAATPGASLGGLQTPAPLLHPVLTSSCTSSCPVPQVQYRRDEEGQGGHGRGGRSRGGDGAGSSAAADAVPHPLAAVLGGDRRAVVIGGAASVPSQLAQRGRGGSRGNLQASGAGGGAVEGNAVLRGSKEVGLAGCVAPFIGASCCCTAVACCSAPSKFAALSYQNPAGGDPCQRGKCTGGECDACITAGTAGTAGRSVRSGGRPARPGAAPVRSRLPFGRRCCRRQRGGGEGGGAVGGSGHGWCRRCNGLASRGLPCPARWAAGNGFLAFWIGAAACCEGRGCGPTCPFTVCMLPAPLCSASLLITHFTPTICPITGSSKSAKRRAAKKKSMASVLGGGGEVRLLNAAAAGRPPLPPADAFPALPGTVAAGSQRPASAGSSGGGGSVAASRPSSAEPPAAAEGYVQLQRDDWESVLPRASKKALPRPPSAQEIAGPSPQLVEQQLRIAGRRQAHAEERAAADAGAPSPSHTASAAAAAAAAGAGGRPAGISEALRQANKLLIEKIRSQLDSAQFAQFRWAGRRVGGGAAVQSRCEAVLLGLERQLEGEQQLPWAWLDQALLPIQSLSACHGSCKRVR